MMQAIQIHNNQHFEEELVLGLQRREALVALAVGVVAVRVVAVVVVETFFCVEIRLVDDVTAESIVIDEGDFVVVVVVVVVLFA